jgi:hypothetical protein
MYQIAKNHHCESLVLITQKTNLIMVIIIIIIIEQQ